MKLSRRNREKAARAFQTAFDGKSKPPKVSKYASKQATAYKDRVQHRDTYHHPRPASFYSTQGED